MGERLPVNHIRVILATMASKFRPHKRRAGLAFPEVPPADRILEELPRLAEAIRRLQDREAQRLRNRPAERNPLRAAEQAMIEEELAAHFAEHRLLPLSERVPEYAIVPDADRGVRLERASRPES